MSVISVITMFFEPKEPVLTQLSREAIQSILAENETLMASCAASREALAQAFASPIDPALERPSTGFIVKRAKAEERSGLSYSKFFTS